MGMKLLFSCDNVENLVVGAEICEAVLSMFIGVDKMRKALHIKHFSYFSNKSMLFPHELIISDSVPEVHLGSH